MECRTGCGACCIAPSINQALPGMPQGKPAGVRCINLDENNRCQLFGLASRPAVCAQFQAEPEVCGESRAQALNLISILELATARTE